MNKKIKVVVIGGTGLIGKKVVMNLGQRGHEVVAASPSSGVNTVTGEGLAQALAGAAGGRRCLECAQLGGQRSPGVFRDIGSQPPGRGSRRGRRPSRRVVGRRHRPAARQWLLPREAGSGKTNQGFLGSLHDRARHAFLRVRRRHRPIGDGRADGPASTGHYAAHCVG
jgi:hypothetical protein